MKTVVCPTCGCSLVRLGVTKEHAVIRKYREKEYLLRWMCRHVR